MFNILLFHTWDRVIKVFSQLVTQSVEPAYRAISLHVAYCIPGQSNKKTSVAYNKQ